MSIPRNIIVDYGSDEKSIKWIRNLFDYDNGVTKSTLIEINGTPDMSNKTATNYAIEKVRTKYTVITDIDCVFGEQFGKVLMKYLSKRNHMVVGIPMDVEWGVRQIGWHDKAGVGSCIAVETDWLKKNPFDENFKHWGLSDADLVRRAEKKFHRVTLTDGLGLYNRVHERPPKPSIKENKLYFDKKWSAD